MGTKTKIVIVDNDEALTSENMEEHIKKHSSEMINNFNFVTEQGKLLPVEYITIGCNNIDRKQAVVDLNKHINNMSICTEIEEGLFEFTFVYSKINNLLPHIIYGVYKDNLMNIIDNINKNGSVGNDYLISNIQNGTLYPKTIAFLSPIEMFPNNWEYYNRKNTLRKYKEENMAATDNYECKKCHERKCKVTQLQTRSADEPMTNFVSCLVCGFTFKC